MLMSVIVSAIKADLRFLHESWMELLFQQQRGGGHPVLGRYRPKSTPRRLFYYFWAITGIPVSVLVYPFVVIGFLIRVTTMTFSQTAARLGLLGVTILVGVVWGLLAVLAFFQLEMTEFLAVFAAAVVATVSAAASVLAHDHGGRATTVAFAYPFGMTAIFLPPIVAAVLWDPLGDILLPASNQLAIIILDDFLFVFGLNELIREAFDLEGVGFIGMWLALSFLIGWVLGTLVTLADAVRPREEEGQRPVRQQY